MSRSQPSAPPAAGTRETTVVLAAIEAMESTLAVADALVAGHRRIDLAGLENEIGRLCAAAMIAPKEAAPMIRLRLEALRLAIDRLHAGLSCA